MNRRTGLLLAAAGSIGLLYGVDSGYRGLIEEPRGRYEQELERLDQELGDAESSQVEGRRLVKKLDEYAERSLPFQPELARSRYQEWLLGLVAKHSLQAAAVDAETPREVDVRSRTSRSKRRRVGYRIGYSLRAKASMQQVTDFFYDFHHSAQLHKIVDFSLTPLSDGTQLDLNLSIETLTLEASDREGELSSWVRTATSYPARGEFDAMVQRNIFAKGFSKMLAEIRLSAVTEDRVGQAQAWFAVGPQRTTQRLRVGQNLDLPLHSVRVLAIEQGQVQLSVNEQECWLKLGQSLGDLWSKPEALAGGGG